ncbi:hypothetical protein GCM10027275_46510 [Rhabdobacter roseus]
MFSNFFGFLIPLYIAYEYKISEETDNFFLSYSIILFIGTIFSGAVRSASIPFLKEQISNKSNFSQLVYSLTYYIIKYVSLLCVLILVILYVFIQIYSNTLYWYLFLSVPIILFSVVNSFFYGVLNSIDQYNVAELSPLSRAIIIFFTIFVFSKELGMIAVIIGYNLGEMAKFLHLLFIIKVRNRINSNYKLIELSKLKTLIKQGLYQILSSTIAGATPLIDRIVASFLIIGSISMLDYGDKVFMVFHAVLNSFLVLILSKWSKDVIERQFSITKLNKAMLYIFIIGNALFGAVIVFGYDIINLLYPKIGENSKETITIILIANTAGFIFNSVTQVINRASIAIKSTKIMLKSSLIKGIINIILDIIFIQIWGVIGIAFATIGVHFTGLIVNYYLFKREYKLKYNIEKY